MNKNKIILIDANNIFMILTQGTDIVKMFYYFYFTPAFPLGGIWELSLLRVGHD